VGRLSLFDQTEDNEAFERVLAEGVAKAGLPIFASTLVPNHWQLFCCDLWMRRLPGYGFAFSAVLWVLLADLPLFCPPPSRLIFSQRGGS